MRRFLDGMRSDAFNIDSKDDFLNFIFLRAGQEVSLRSLPNLDSKQNKTTSTRKLTRRIFDHLIPKNLLLNDISRIFISYFCALKFQYQDILDDDEIFNFVRCFMLRHFYVKYSEYDDVKALLVTSAECEVIFNNNQYLIDQILVNLQQSES